MKPKFEATKPLGPRPSYLPLALGVGTAVYAGFFFSTPDTSRLGALARLLIPDVVFAQWCGGTAAHFTVLDRAPVFLAAAAILTLAWAVGDLLLGGLKLGAELDRLEQYVFAQAMGLATLANFTLAMGLCGLLHQRALFALAAVGIIALQVLRRWRSQGQAKASAHRPGIKGAGATRLLAIGGVLAIPFLAAYVLGGVLPPWDFDVREYHLQVPKEWFLDGRIAFLPHNVYGNMPLGAEMFAILGSECFAGEQAWWPGALAGKLIMALFAPLGALGLFAAGRRFWSPAAGLMAALVYLSLPGLLGNAVAGLNETPLATYLLLAVYAALRWQELSRTPEHAALARGFLLVAGYLAGAAAGCKYPAVLFLLAPLAVVVLMGPRANASRAAWGRSFRWRAGGIFLLAAAAGGGLWYAKSWVLTGNPVYPLAYNVFGGATRTPEKDRQWRHAVQVPGDDFAARYGVRSAGAAATNIFLRSEQLGLMLWPAALAALLCARRDGRVRTLALLLAYMFLTWWLVTHRIERFWLPFLPLAALLAGYALGALWKLPAGRILAGVLLAATLVQGLAGGALGIFAQVNGQWQLAPYPYFVALEEQRNSPERVNPFQLYLNTHVPHNSAVLLVGDAEPFDLTANVLYNTCFDDCRFEQLLRDRSPAERRAVLREHGISHIYVHWGHIDRYRSPGNYGFTNWVQPAVFSELVATGVLQRVDGIEASPWHGEVYAVAPRTAR